MYGPSLPPAISSRPGRRRRALSRALVVGACAAAVFAGACSSSDSESSDTTTTSAKVGGTTASSVDSADTPDSGSEDSSDSGFDTGTAVLVDGEATPEHTITINADGSATPDMITVGVGELFTIKNDGAGILGLEIGGGDSVTTPNGVASTFTMAEAGKYQVTDLVNEDISATVIVE